MGRADLALNPRFAELSPGLGTIDLAALDAALADDADDTLLLLHDMARATDERLRAQVRRMVPRIILDQTRRGLPRSAGVARRRTQPAADLGELDLDRSMDRVLAARAEGRAPRVDELLSSDWARPGLALCLLIDRSGSMNGRRLTTAAVATAACASLVPREHAVVSFAAQVDVIKALRHHRAPTETVAEILSLQGHGTTSLDLALASARRELSAATARRTVTVLLSDCRATDGSAVLAAAAALTELVIIAPGDDSDAARQLAAGSGARWAAADSVLEVPRLLNRMLADDRV